MALATRQWGVVAGRQLRDLGVGRGAVNHWRATGRLHALYRGIYAVGHTALRREGHWMAAVLACGPGAVLSHISAAALWAIRATVVHVSARRSRHGHPGIKLHRPRALLPGDVTERDGIPTTTPARTLHDLRTLLPLGDYERAVARAERAGLVVPTADAKLTESEAERLMLDLIRRTGVPEPDANVWLPPWEIKVDFLWRAQRLVVEIDGFATHATRSAFESDRARDQALVAAGYRVLRFTWRQLVERPDDVIETLRRSIAR